MLFTNSLGSLYNPEKHRIILQAAETGAEIENSFHFPVSLRNVFISEAVKHGVSLAYNEATSYYFDTRKLGFFANGYSLRMRPSGAATNAKGHIVEEYPPQFALKSVHREYQNAAQEVVTQRPQLGRIIHPVIRKEVEGEHTLPLDADELRFGDLPQSAWHGLNMSIASAAKSLIYKGRIKDVTHTDNLVLIPWVSTCVERTMATFYIEPGKRFDFQDMWPHTMPTSAMIKSGKYICIEVAMDHCTIGRCLSGQTMGEMLAAHGKNTSVSSTLGEVPLFEFEVKAKKCGSRITDGEVFRCFTAFANRIVDFAEQQSLRIPLYNNDNWQGVTTIVRASSSKAGLSYGALPECQVDGALYHQHRAGTALGL